MASDNAAAFVDDAMEQYENTKKYIHIFVKMRADLAVVVLVAMRKAIEIAV